SVDMTSRKVSDGTEIDVTVRVYSDVPIDLLYKSFYSPIGYIYGHGTKGNFIELETDIWEYSWTDKVSQNAPKGKYFYEGISVENEGDLESDIWPDELSLIIE
ncbi:MAG: hypothetical protein ACOC1K_06710, partial [Nanoarchaeota archaeon]